MYSQQISSLLEQVIFDNVKTKAQVRIQKFLYIVLFLAGIAHWIFFFNAGNLSLTAYDWLKEDAYLTILRLAQLNSSIPWNWSDGFFHGTDKFLANPEVVLTPDIILLRWISSGSFIVLHTVLLYTIGFVGSLSLAKKQNASFFAFSFFWLLFNFNGYLTAHLAIGHFQWTGYFLLPYFFILLFRFAEKSQSAVSFDRTAALSMALLFGVLFLNGSLHIAVWCFLFMLLAVLLRWAMLLNVLVSITVGFALGLGRLLPAAMWFPKKTIFLSGYPTFGTFLDALTSLRLHNFGKIQGINWWEYDMFIGFFGLALLITLFIVAVKFKRLPTEPYIFIAAGVLLLLALGNIYSFFTKFPLPFVSIERVASRFAIIPFILVLVATMSGIDQLLDLWKKHTKTLITLGMILAAGELIFHSYYWRVSYIEQSFQNIAKPATTIVFHLDQAYFNSVYASYLISFVVLVVAVSLALRNLYVNNHNKVWQSMHRTWLQLTSK